MMKIDLPNEDSTNVIELSVVRESRYGRALLNKCTQAKVRSDTSLAALQCK
jgi:hypothetical protein